MLFKGTDDNFRFDKFIENCRGVSQTLCIVKTIKGSIFGMYTNIPWNDNKQYATGDWKSFVFKFDDQNKIV